MIKEDFLNVFCKLTYFTLFVLSEQWKKHTANVLLPIEAAVQIRKIIPSRWEIIF